MVFGVVPRGVPFEVAPLSPGVPSLSLEKAE